MISISLESIQSTCSAPHRCIYVWPDGTWCWPDELSEFSHKSDDYACVEITDDCDEEDVERIADMHCSIPF